MNRQFPAFGEALRERRQRLGLTLYELARRIHKENGEPVTPQYVSYLEHGQRMPSTDHLMSQLAAATGLDRAWLYYLSGRYPPETLDPALQEADFRHRFGAFQTPPPKRPQSAIKRHKAP